MQRIPAMASVSALFFLSATILPCARAAAGEPSPAASTSPEAAPDLLPTGDMVMMRPAPGGVAWGMGATPAIVSSARECREPLQFVLPSVRRETSRFGQRSDPIDGGRRLHAGVDLAAPAGSAVFAAGGGVVVRAGWSGGYGNLVEIDHGQGVTTRYAHLARSLVRGGDEISAEQVIGLVGATGHATGSHLHFEIRRGGLALDPDRAGMRFCGFDPADMPFFAARLVEVPRRSDWTDPARDGALPSNVLQ